MVEKSDDLSGPAGICGDLLGPAGICGDLQGSAGICLASPSGTLCNLVVGPGVFPRPAVISPGQNSLQDWTDYDSKSVLVLPSGQTDCPVANTDSFLPPRPDANPKISALFTG